MLRAALRISPLFALATAGFGDCDSSERAEKVEPEIGRRVQALTDTDSDGMDDDWEVLHFGNLSRNGTGDYDSDGLTDLEEYQHDFNPTVDDGFEDADGDRYPNVFEVRRGSDPNDDEDLPTPNYLVNGAGGGDYTTINGAVSAATTANGNYQIIEVAAGTYSGMGNVNLSVASTKPRLLILGAAGAASTIIDGGGSSLGWTLSQGAVIASLTFRNTTRAIYLNASGKEVRLVDLALRKNAYSGSHAGGVHVAAVSKLHLVGCTLLDNTSTTGSAQQVYLTNGTTYLTNTVVYGAASSAHLWKHATNATLEPTYSLVKGYTLSGTGNLSSSTEPKLRSDGHLLHDSPLREAGGTVSQSRLDLDLEPRPGSSPDIGADQFVDTDEDELADWWELGSAGNLEDLTGPTQDYDEDGLTNAEEYALGTDPQEEDTDGDGLSDGAEVNTHGTDPLSTDSDGDDMPDGWEVTNELDPLVNDAFDDADGDRYPNVFEYIKSTDPQDEGSMPSADITVSVAGGADYTNISGAVNAATTTNGQYQIIRVEGGTYTGNANCQINIASNKPRLLLIGAAGAAGTVVDCNGAASAWYVHRAAVLASLTLRRFSSYVFYVSTSNQVRFLDLVVRDNSTHVGAVYAINSPTVQIVGSTFVNNIGLNYAHQFYLYNSQLYLVNVVAWNESGGTAAYISSATLSGEHSLVHGVTLAGSNNLSGSTDPKVRADGRIRHDSPLRQGGGPTAQSRLDMDLEPRPETDPDIGADQFLDSDEDDLADWWELATAGNLEDLTGPTQDLDEDGLTNAEEYVVDTDPAQVDTDGDGLSDGAEVHTHGTNPLSTDTDGDDMPDGWEVTHDLDPVVDDAFDDADGDRYPNVFEYAGSTDPEDDESNPSADITVDGAGGGDYTTISGAVVAATTTNGAYQIIHIAPGVYTGSSNCTVNIASHKPRLLVIGVAGAARTVVDCAGASSSWYVYRGAVLASLTFRRFTNYVFYVVTGDSYILALSVLTRRPGCGGIPGHETSRHRSRPSRHRLAGPVEVPPPLPLRPQGSTGGAHASAP